ncbi:MAG: alpha/beta hydrolase [Chloroflexi bacterium]|nr:alpha/beta hydrolase [Chloroflexota bacterium]
MSITTVNTNLIHYEVLGRGQPLIFLHGWIGSWRYWWPSMQAMSSQHRSFAFDLWGFGDSSKTPSLYSLDAYVAMVHTFIDQLGVARPVNIIGHTLGAAVGLRYMLNHPKYVEKLVTVSLPIKSKYINEKITDSNPDIVLNKILGKSNSYSEVDSEIRKTDQLAFTTLTKEIADCNFAQEIEDSPRPILLLYGDQDNVITPPADEDEYLRETGNNRYFVSLACHHFPMLQEKTKFNRLLLDFILAGDDLTELAPKEYWSRRTR